MNLKNAMFNPIKLIQARAKKIKFIEDLKLLIISALFLAIAIAIISMQAGAILGPMLSSLGATGAAITVFIVTIISVLVFGFFTSIVMTTLGGKGSYYSGVSALTIPVIPFSVGFLISAILSVIPILGGIIAFFVMALFASLSVAALYRSIKEIFKVDYITVLIGISLIGIAVMIAFYVAVIAMISSVLSYAPELATLIQSIMQAKMI